jgi:hypothetical protein
MTMEFDVRFAMAHKIRSTLKAVTVLLARLLEAAVRPRGVGGVLFVSMPSEMRFRIACKVAVSFGALPVTIVGHSMLATGA